MNNSKRLSIAMRRQEMALGWLYFPFYLVFTGQLLSMAFLALGWPVNTPQGMARLNGGFYLVNFLVALVIFRRFLAASLAQVGRKFWGFVQAVILGLAMYYLGSLALTALKDWLAPNLQNVNDANVAGMIAAQRWIMLAGTVLLAPLAEECFIRGLIFQGLHRKNRWAAYALSTLAFCCLHIYGYIGAYPPLTLVLCALDYVPAGIALAWSYEKADTIFAPILMHCLINALAFQALG